MKTQTGLKQKMLLVTMTVVSISMSIGCASKKDGGGDTSGGDATAAPAAVRTEANYSADFNQGAIGKVENLDRTALSSYAATHPINNPKNANISVRLFKAGDVAGNGGYAGVVQFAYEDNGQYYVGRFTTNDSYNPTGSTANAGTRYTNWHHAAYNKWFNYGGKRLFHGFFEDEYGAIMLIVEDNLDQGDGAGSSQVTGSIWFKNYYNSPYPRYQTKDVLPCWFITAGPYDCRTFLVKTAATGKDGDVQTTSALLPTQSLYAPGADTHPYHQGADAGPARGWKKIGSFSGLDAAKAFDN
jgi:hypothetical protein